MITPKSFVRFLFRKLRQNILSVPPNLRGVIQFGPGNFYSPLLNLKDLGPNDQSLPFDGEECWEHINLRLADQRRYYGELLDVFLPSPFPGKKTANRRYFSDNNFFGDADGFALSAIIQKEKPRRIIEVGSGFSSAVMLDTLEDMKHSAQLTFIEPYPERLYSLLSSQDKSLAKIHVSPVQEVPLEEFDQLAEGDILFIDSSHVAKVGSDVPFVFLRILPRLKPGVIVHFHDIFYPHSYPAEWLRVGRAWNESLFLRVFLIGHPQYQMMAFNSFAAHQFPELFQERWPNFLATDSASIWLRKTA